MTEDKLSGYPRTQALGGEPGINCMRMHLIFIYLTFNPGNRLRQRHDSKDFRGMSELYLCYNGLLGVLGLIQCFSLLVEGGGER